MWRFKTKKEFKKEGRWDSDEHCPEDWNDEGNMNKYMGQPVPDKFHDKCKSGEGFYMDNWYFQGRDYIKVDGLIYEIY